MSPSPSGRSRPSANHPTRMVAPAASAPCTHSAPHRPRDGPPSPLPRVVTCVHRLPSRSRTTHHRVVIRSSGKGGEGGDLAGRQLDPVCQDEPWGSRGAARRRQVGADWNAITHLSSLSAVAGRAR